MKDKRTVEELLDMSDIPKADPNYESEADKERKKIIEKISVWINKKAEEDIDCSFIGSKKIFGTIQMEDGRDAEVSVILDIDLFEPV